MNENKPRSTDARAFFETLDGGGRGVILIGHMSKLCAPRNRHTHARAHQRIGIQSRSRAAPSRLDSAQRTRAHNPRQTSHTPHTRICVSSSDFPAPCDPAPPLDLIKPSRTRVTSSSPRLPHERRRRRWRRSRPRGSWRRSAHSHRRWRRRRTPHPHPKAHPPDDATRC